MTAAIGHQLDYPNVNCNQCATNYDEDAIEPDCAACPVARWDSDVWTVLLLHERGCPWGKLEYNWLKSALHDLQVPTSRRQEFRRHVLTVHRIIKQYYAEHHNQSRD